MRVTLNNINTALNNTGYFVEKLASFPVYGLHKKPYLRGQAIEGLTPYHNNPDKFLVSDKVYRPLVKIMDDVQVMRLIEVNTIIQLFDENECIKYLDKVINDCYICKIDLIRMFDQNTPLMFPSSLDYLFPRDICHMYHHRCLDLKLKQPKNGDMVLGNNDKPTQYDVVLSPNNK